MKVKVKVQPKEICWITTLFISVIIYLHFVIGFIHKIISNGIYRILLDYVLIVIGFLISGILSDVVCHYFYPIDQSDKNESDENEKNEDKTISKTTCRFLLFLAAAVIYVNLVPCVFKKLFLDNKYVEYFAYFVSTAVFIIIAEYTANKICDYLYKDKQTEKIEKKD